MKYPLCSKKEVKEQKIKLMRLNFTILWLFIIFSTGKAQIIFETNFVNDAGYYKTNQGLHEYDDTPEGWDGILATGNSVISVISNKGVDGIKPALKLTWDPNLGQPTVQLLKHLTNNPNTGYEELFIRYHVKLPNNFKVGGSPRTSDSNIVVPYWKWGRLWQNTGLRGAGWTENRDDSFYFVWNFGGSKMWGIDVACVFSANVGNNLHLGSAGGERYGLDYYSGTGDFTKKPGHFEAMGSGGWEIDWTTNPGFLTTKLTGGNQEWHTYEIHVKLASSPTANDGIWEIWFDGVKQDWVRFGPAGGAPTVTPIGVATSKHGSGLNFFVCFDNMSWWNDDWGKSEVDGFIWVNDIVVSTEHIGHSYIANQVTEIREITKQMPSNFNLEQNYPNPFNPTTTIKYSIPNVASNFSSSVVLKVYDVLGKEVALLVNEEKSPGNYAVTFDSQNIPSGTYFYQLSVGSFIQTKKMILLR